MKKKNKKAKATKKPTEEEIEQAMEDDETEDTREWKEGYGPPEPGRIVRILTLGGGAIAVLRESNELDADNTQELIYMNANLKHPIKL